MRADIVRSDECIALRAPVSANDVALGPWAAEVSTSLRSAFGAEFDLVDGTTGEPISCASDRTVSDWMLRGELCRTVAQRGRAELLLEDSPLAVLAIPVSRSA